MTRGELLDQRRSGVLHGPGEVDVAIRQAAFSETDDLTEPLAGYIDTVRRHAYKVTDADIDRLRTEGYTDDAIYEVTVAAALGAGLRRLDRARALL